MIETSNNAMPCHAKWIRIRIWAAVVFTVYTSRSMLLCSMHIKMYPQGSNLSDWRTLSSNGFNQTNYAGFRFFSVPFFPIKVSLSERRFFLVALAIVINSFVSEEWSHKKLSWIIKSNQMFKLFFLLFASLITIENQKQYVWVIPISCG